MTATQTKPAPKAAPLPPPNTAYGPPPPAANGKPKAAPKAPPPDELEVLRKIVQTVRELRAANEEYQAALEAAAEKRKARDRLVETRDRLLGSACDDLPLFNEMAWRARPLTDNWGVPLRVSSVLFGLGIKTAGELADRMDAGSQWSVNSTLTGNEIKLVEELVRGLRNGKAV